MPIEQPVTPRSPFVGSSALDMLAQLESVAARSPRDIALIEESGKEVTYAAFVARVTRVRKALVRHGMQRGDRVLFAVRPSVTAVATIVALTELGAVLVAAQVGVGDTLFAAQMRTVQPTWVIAETALVAAMRNRVLRALLRMRGSALPSFESLRGARVITTGPWFPFGGHTSRLEHLESLGGGEWTADDEPLVRDGDDALMVFTSGTTAAPKVVVHTRSSLAATLHAVSRHLPVKPGDRIYARDLHLIIPALLSGATAFVPRSAKQSPRSLLSSIVRHGITHLFEVTAHLEELVAHLEATDQMLPDVVRRILVGAAPVRAAFFERLSRCIQSGTQAWCVYGMTEMLPVAAIELREKLSFTGDGDIVGKPIDGVTTAIDTSGELVVSGAHLFNRYLGHRPVTEHATGDLATFDAAGRILLRGRTRDMIIRGAHNIYPALHEPVIERIDGVARAAIIGVFDELKHDERVVLVVEPVAQAPSAAAQRALVERIATALRTTHRIDDAALPDDIVVANIPLSGRSSKVDKALLRQKLLDITS